MIPNKYSILIALVFYQVFAACQSGNVDQAASASIVYTCPPCGCPDDGKLFDRPGTCPSCNMILNPQLNNVKLERRSRPTPSVGIFVFEGADVMDVTGPLSVFEHAGFNVITFGLSMDKVGIGRTLEIAPEATVDNLPDVDILVFPGSGLAETNPGHMAVVRFIQQRLEQTEVLFSVCSGAFFLAEAGVLKGRRATTFASMIPMLHDYEGTIVVNDAKFTDNGKVVTSSGLSSGIDAAFHVVGKFVGHGRAQDIANHMEYPRSREKDYARSQLADNYGGSIKSLIRLFATEYFYSQGDKNYWEYRYKLTQQLKAEEILSLLFTEIKKRDDWTAKKKNRNELSVDIDHPVLGPGKMSIRVDDSTGQDDVLILTVNRNNPI